MAIHETKKQSDLEKRLKLLRQQVYGKASEHSENSVNQNVRYTDTPSLSDTLYLRHDLLKILILATSAIALQIILFVLSKNHVLNLNFF